MAAALQMFDMDCRFETWKPPPNFIDKTKLKGIPRHGIGRGFKAGKEEIAGLITALEIYHEKNHEKELSKYERMTKYLTEALQGLSGINATYLPPEETRTIPLTELRFTHLRKVPEIVNVLLRLRSSNPPIYLDESRLDEMVLQVDPFNLEDNDLDIIVQRIKEITGTS